MNNAFLHCHKLKAVIFLALGISWLASGAMAQTPQPLPPANEVFAPPATSSTLFSSRYTNAAWAPSSNTITDTLTPNPPQPENESWITSNPEQQTKVVVDSGRPGVFQGASFQATFLPDLVDPPDLTELELWSNFAFPMPTRESPLILTPGFQTRFLEGPNRPDLPGTLYDAYLQIRWMSKINDRWGIDLMITPGVHSDFKQGDDSAIRVPIRGLASYQWSPATKVILGVVYLDRSDVIPFPAGGVIYTPDDNTKWELIIPTPRYSRRISVDNLGESWVYLAAEFGGGSWAVKRASGQRDQLRARDYRFLAGWERKATSGITRRWEVGYVFGREYEFASGTPSYQPDGTILARMRLSY